ncbi:pikachurin-like isoform X1 [Oscarella lobularis]|uniref:pikachurin-like isoform X1 n=1 Tax=Oscarella lobularis TaxID=121494 RepID=UPI003313A282
MRRQNEYESTRRLIRDVIKRCAMTAYLSICLLVFVIFPRFSKTESPGTVTCYDCRTKEGCLPEYQTNCKPIAGPKECPNKPPCYIHTMWQSGSLSRTKLTCSGELCENKRQCTCYCVNATHVPRKISTGKAINPCNAKHRCRTPDSCRYTPGDNRYHCSCPIRKAGVYCERDVSSGFAYFRRISYAVYETYFPHPKRTEFSIKFKTKSARSALLLYLPPVRPYKIFFALGITNGELHLRFDVGNGQQILQTNLKVDDGRWHVAHIKRYQHSVKLTVDKTIYNSQKYRKNISARFTINNKIYIGGLPAESVMLKPYKSGFDGCIANFKMSRKTIKLYKDALTGRDVSLCS